MEYAKIISGQRKGISGEVLERKKDSVFLFVGGMFATTEEIKDCVFKNSQVKLQPNELESFFNN